MLQWLCQQGIALSPQTCREAAAGGHLVVLQWARKQGSPALNGNLTMLRYAHQHGCKWCQRTCAAAAGGGHLAVLQYAHQNGCAWGPEPQEGCSAAAEHGHHTTLK